MKVLVRGNSVMIQSNIDAADLEELKNYDVGLIEDAEGNQVYRMSKAESFAGLSKYGFTGNTVFQNKLTASTIVEDNEDGTAMEQFLKDIKPALLALKENEQVINEQITQMKYRLEGLDDAIIVEE